MSQNEDTPLKMALAVLFWLAVLSGIGLDGYYFGMNGIGILFGCLIGIGLLYALGMFVVVIGRLIYEGYFHLTYTRNSLCPQRDCHKPGEWVSKPTDGQYGSSKQVLMCPDGHGSIPVGGGHQAAEWAGF